MRHNEANGEDNRDGHGHNLSWNCGWEGPTEDPEVNARRARLKRALLATVLLAQGTPMLAAGDELGHSQGGNNNPYCQDNAITWIDWAQRRPVLIDFTAHVLALRRRLLPMALRWYTGLPDRHGHVDLAWLRRTGEEMTPEHWNNRMSRILGAWMGLPGRGDAPLLLMVNARDIDAGFTLPPGNWVAELDTTQPDGRSTWRRAGRRRSRALHLAGSQPRAAARRRRTRQHPRNRAMRFPRASGVLLHPTSLPGPHGSGDFGSDATALCRLARRPAASGCGRSCRWAASARAIRLT